MLLYFSGRNSGVTLQGSPQMAQTNGNGLVVLQNQLYQSTSVSISPNYKSWTLFWGSVAVPGGGIIWTANKPSFTTCTVKGTIEWIIIAAQG